MSWGRGARHNAGGYGAESGEGAGKGPAGGHSGQRTETGRCREKIESVKRVSRENSEVEEREERRDEEEERSCPDKSVKRRTATQKSGKLGIPQFGCLGATGESQAAGRWRWGPSEPDAFSTRREQYATYTTRRRQETVLGSAFHSLSLACPSCTSCLIKNNSVAPAK